tara:strand:+ start:1746 stop:2342 length:597 start_codon:yes stop_codon:yes gene_type:complete
MFNCIDYFYDANDLGLVALNFLNFRFTPSVQSQEHYYGGDRLKGWPCYETELIPKENEETFIKTFEKKTNMKIFHVNSFYRKTKKSEVQKSPSYGQFKQHTDSPMYDIAGVIYFNSNSLEDGTRIYMTEQCFEPTAIIGSRGNRCVFYGTQVWHCPPMLQTVDERWTQPLFLITKEETYDKFINEGGDKNENPGQFRA